MDMETAVRNLGGAWPSNEPAETELYQFSNGQYAAGLAGGTARYIGNHEEFDATTARLRNEPSFDDHPDAKCFAQSMSGKWFKNTKTTTVMPMGDTWYTPIGGWWIGVQQGEVIGDWRNTLRLRPEEKRMNESMTHQEAERNRRAPDKTWIKNVRDAFTKNAEEFDSLMMSVLNRIDEREGATAPDNTKTSRERVFLEAMNLVDRAEGSVSLDAHRTIRILDNAGMLKMPEEK